MFFTTRYLLIKYNVINSKTFWTVSPAPDKWNFVYLCLIIHGIGTLLPWNMFITAKSYFVDYKFNQTITGEEINYGAYFLSSVGFASQIPNLIFAWTNAFTTMDTSFTIRIVVCILTELIVFLVTTALVRIDSFSWSGIFFWITLASVVVLNTAGGIYQNSVYGMAAILPVKYVGAAVLGSNISGVFTTIISILSTQFATSIQTAVVGYFVTAMVLLSLCIELYFAMTQTNFYYWCKRRTISMRLRYTQHPSGRWTTFKDAKVQLFNIFFIYFITLAIFPTMHSDIKQTSPTFIFGDKLFTDITCYLTFSVCSMLGSLTTSWITWPKPEKLIIPVLARAIFIPLFLLCNYRPLHVERTLPVYITSDYVYWGFAVVMAYSSGYLGSLGMMYASQTVNPRHAVQTSTFAAAMLVTGVFSGLLFSMWFPFLVGI